MRLRCLTVRTHLFELAMVIFPTVLGASSAEHVWIDRIPVRPGGNLIYDEGKLELHPKVLLGLGYDSNVDAASSTPEDDVYARGLAGLLLYWLPSTADRFNTDVQVEAKRYLDRDDRDFTGGRLQVGWVRESALGPLATVMIEGMLADDPLIETGRQVQRARYDGQADWWMRGTANSFRLGGGVVGEDFLENAGVFDEDERDYLRPQATAEWWHGRADGPTRFGVQIAFDYIDYRQSGSDYQDGSGVKVLGLLTHFFTPLLQLRANLGIEYRRYRDGFANNPLYDDQILTHPVGELLLRWDPEEYSQFDLGVSSILVPTIESNAAQVVRFLGHGRWRVQRSAGILAEVDVYDLRYSGSATGNSPDDVTLRIRAGVEFWARDGLVIRALGGIDVGDPEGRAGYERILGTLDTAFVW